MQPDDLSWLLPENDPVRPKPRYVPLSHNQEQRLRLMNLDEINRSTFWQCHTAKDRRFMEALEKRGFVYHRTEGAWQLTHEGKKLVATFATDDLPF